MALKFRRGSTADKSGSLAFGEPYVNTSLGTLQIGGNSGDITLATVGNTSELNVSAVSASTFISASTLHITTNAEIKGNLTLGGNITIGDQTSDTVAVNANLSSSLIPSEANKFDLGSETKFWRDIYVSTGSIKFVNAGGTVVSSLSATSLNSNTESINSLNSYTASNNTNISAIQTSTSSLNAFSASVRASGSIINTFTASVNTSTSSLNSFSASVIATGSIINTFTSSVNTSTSSLNAFSASVRASGSIINTFTSSVNTSTASLNSFSASVIATGSIINTFTASVNTSTSSLNSFSSSVLAGLEFTSSNVTVKGNLLVKGTTTTIDSTTVNVADNIIQLNGTGATNAGIVVRDATAATTTSGSFLWDTTNDKWIAGALGAEDDVVLRTTSQTLTNKTISGASNTLSNIANASLTNSSITIAGVSTALGSSITAATIGNAIGAFSGSSQVTISSTTGYTTFSSSIAAIDASQDAELTALETASGSLNAFSASVRASGSIINTFTSSVNTSTGSLNTFSASVIATGSIINTFTSSVNSFSASVIATGSIINTFTSSVNTSTSSLNSFSASVIATGSIINTFTSSVNSFSASVIATGSIINTFTSSVNTSTSSLNSFSASVIATGSIINTFTSSVNTSTSSLNSFSASVIATGSIINTFTSSVNSFSASVIATGSLINTFTSSVNTSTSSLNAFSASVRASGSVMNTFTSSVNTATSSLNSFSASVIATGSIINTFTSSVNTFTSSVNTSTSSLNSFSSSVLAGLEFTSSNVTVKGNLLVKGTTTTIDSTTVNVADNIIQLNGTGATNAGIVVRDATAATTISGSFLWDTTNDKWIAGALGSEDDVVLRTLGQTLTNKTISGASNTLSNIANASLTNSSITIAGVSTALGSSITAATIGNAIGAFSGSSQVTLSSTTGYSAFSSSIAAIDASQDAEITALETASGSLNSFTSSINTTIKNRLTAEGVISGSSQVYSGVSGDVVIASNGVATIQANSVALGTDTTGDYVASLVAGTNITLTNNSGEGATPTIALTNNSITIAGQSTSLGGTITAATIGNAIGAFSGSSQVSHDSTTGYSANRHVDHTAVSITAGTGLTGGGDISTTRTLSIDSTVATLTGVQTLTNKTIAAASNTISGLTNSNLSGTAGISNANLANSSVTVTAGTGMSGGGTVALGSSITLTNAGVTSNVAGTGVTVSGATGAVTISIGQAVATSSNVQFNSLGVGMAASATAGRIDATNDIVAYSSSDRRFKNNIKAIEKPLDKINKISGNTFDWNEENKIEHGYEGNDVGVIAQEIEEVLPQLVQTRENGYKAVKYDKLVALLIEGIKEQQIQINDMKVEIENLKRQKGL